MSVEEGPIQGNVTDFAWDNEKNLFTPDGVPTERIPVALPTPQQ